MPVPKAYLLTWTCYGTWLHGDKRGSVDAEHNTFRTPFLDPDAWRARGNAARLLNRPVTLDDRARQIVSQTIVAHCEHRGWDLVGLNVRSNHVHVVLACGETSPDAAMDQLKSWTTRRLREAEDVSSNARVWTHHGSTRYLWNDHSIARAVEYVTDYQRPDCE